MVRSSRFTSIANDRCNGHKRVAPLRFQVVHIRDLTFFPLVGVNSKCWKYDRHIIYKPVEKLIFESDQTIPGRLTIDTFCSLALSHISYTTGDRKSQTRLWRRRGSVGKSSTPRLLVLQIKQAFTSTWCTYTLFHPQRIHHERYQEQPGESRSARVGGLAPEAIGQESA